MLGLFLWFLMVTCSNTLAQDFFTSGLFVPPVAFNASQDRLVIEKWKHLEKTLSGTLDEIMKRALPTIIRTGGEAGLSGDCQASFIRLVIGLRNLKSWAFRMLDALGKPPGGLLDGTLTALGSYDECLKIRVPDSTHPDLIDFTGKYCTVELKLPLPPKPDYLTVHFRNTFLENVTSGSIIRDIYELSHYFYLYSYRMGVCIPSTCTEEDVLKLGNLVTQKLPLDLAVPRCETKDPVLITTAQIVVMCVFGFLFALVLFATLAEVVYEKFLKDRPDENPSEKSPVIRFLCCYSLLGNFPKLFSEETTVPTPFLHGMRAISIGWLILGGVFMLINYQILKQSREAVDFSRSILMQAILSHSLAIDTLFFTTAYVTGMKIASWKAEKFRVWDYLSLLIKRVFRFTPVHMFMVGVCILIPLATRGPLWQETLLPVHDNCVNYWWTNLFYINNIFPGPDKRCLPNSWYLSAELQLFVIGLLFASTWCTMKRNIGVLLACGAVLVSIVTTGVVTSYFSYPPIALFAHVDLPARARIENALQQKFYPHLPTWFAGLSLGFYQLKKQPLTIKPYILTMGWLLSVTCMSAVVFGIYEWNSQYWMNYHVSALYSAAHRPVWALCITWVAFVCANGNAKTISSFLSWYGFRLLSRLTIFMILTYSLFQSLCMAHVRERLQASSFMSLFLFSGIFVLTCSASTVFYLVVELPILEFRKMLEDVALKRTSLARRMSTTIVNNTVHRKFSTAGLAPPPTETQVKKSPRKFQKRESCQPLNVEEILEKIEIETVHKKN